ncbi:MAG: nucleotidyltransferase family protein, partial [Oligoflexia bacterium]|nr:nucleotidyltransferase family protein [Oligoflexia bacterium]
MGEPKGILRHQDRYWIESQLADFARGGGERAVVVLGHDHQRYFAALPWLEDAVRERTALPSVPRLCLRVAINPEPELGPFSSLQQGICTLRGLLSNIPGPHGAFVLPVDVPAPTPAVWDALARA